MPAGELAPCVFCGEPILPGEETAGRAPMAAHAPCADAALADDTHWEAIAAAGEEPATAGQPTGTRPADAAARATGCLGVLATGLTVALTAAGLLPTLLH